MEKRIGKGQAYALAVLTVFALMASVVAGVGVQEVYGRMNCAKPDDAGDEIITSENENQESNDSKVAEALYAGSTVEKSVAVTEVQKTEHHLPALWVVVLFIVLFMALYIKFNFYFHKRFLKKEEEHKKARLLV